MNVGETDHTKRRIFMVLRDNTGALTTTAASAPPAHALQVSVNGSAFVDGGGSLVHMGDATYYYEATAGEVATAGFLAFKYEAAGFLKSIVRDFVGRPFLAGETSAVLLRLPFVIEDLSSPPVPATGAAAALVLGDLKISINGAAYANVAGTLVEVGSGLYYYQAVAADAAASGIIVLKYKPAATYAEEVVTQSIDAAVTFSTSLTAATAPGVLDADPEVARWTPIHVEFPVPVGYHVTVTAQIGLDSALWMVAYDEFLPDPTGTTGQAAFAPLFADKSTVVITGSLGAGRTFAMDVLPNGGWQRPNVKVVPMLSLEMT